MTIMNSTRTRYYGQYFIYIISSSCYLKVRHYHSSFIDNESENWNGHVIL